MKIFQNSILKNRLVFILALIGFCIALYVTQSFIRQAPIVCINSGCELVRKSPLSYLWGIPIPAIGLAGYGALALLAFLRTFSNAKIHTQLLKGISLFGVLFVSWFTYIEITAIRAVCTWCVISAVNMIIISVILWTDKPYETHR